MITTQKFDMLLYVLCALLLLNAFTTEACIDQGDTKQCQEWKAEGRCKDESDFYMKAFCAQTCRFVVGSSIEHKESNKF
ncbi:hypothetical protein COOONC_24967 [Cooperia oncophora]